MKTTLKARLLTASKKTKELADAAFKKSVSSILSLCMVAGLTVTIITYAQAEGPQFAAHEPVKDTVTMPIMRTITDIKGRTIEGTILTKSDSAITFQRKGDTKHYEINLAMLSEDDRAFIATLLQAPQRTAPDKKPSVLFLVDHSTLYYQDTISMLRNNGFDVTIGVCPRRNAEDGPVNKADQTFDRISKNENAILVSTLEAIDPYDILWIIKFGFYSTEKRAAEAKKIGGFGTDLRPNHFELTRRHQDKKKLTVICSYNKPEPDYYLKENYFSEGEIKQVNKPFAKSHGKSWVFYSSGGSHENKVEIHKKVIEEVRSQLASSK